MSICGGVAGARPGKIKGIVIHNDAGSQNANANFYNIWLRTHPLTNGFTHYYVASDYTLQAEDDSNCAWHCANVTGNTYFLSIEACQSMGDINVFRKNEDNALRLAAQKCKQYGITPNRETIKLHRQFSSTVCPHRSCDIHGGTQGTQDYFIKKIAEYMGTGQSVETAQGITVNTEKDFRRFENMQHTFQIDGLDGIYYFDGTKIIPLHHPDELNILNDIYKRNHGGQAIPFVGYTSNAPWYKRLCDVCNRKPITSYAGFTEKKKK